MWIAAVVVFWAYGGALSLLARRDWAPLRFKVVQAGAIAGFFGLFFLAVWTLSSGSTSRELLLMFPILLVGLGCAFRFVPYVIGEWFESARRSVIGLDSMTVAKTYDLAEKAERDRNLDEAIRLYRAEAERDPRDAEAWRRIGEIEVKRGRPQEALAPFRTALSRLREPEPKTTLAFRLADLLAKQGRTDEAHELVERIAQEFAGTKFEGFAKERLKILARRADNI